MPTVIAAVTAGFKFFRCLASSCSLFGHHKIVWPVALFFQWSKQKSFQMKLLIADRSNKTLNAANGNMLINLFKRYIKSFNGEFSHNSTEKPNRFMCALHLILTHVLLFL